MMPAPGSQNPASAQAGGWLARAGRLLEGQPECAEHGYLLVLAGIRSGLEGDGAKARATFVEAAAIGNRFGDRDLVTLALHGQGRSLIQRGETARGVTLLDEAVVAVTAGEVSPLIAGIVYCSVIESCRETFDRRRAQEWTSALDRWCGSQPDFVPYRGHCLLSRAERHERGIVTDTPDLFFAGLHYLYSMTSATVTGVGRDAERVARAIEVWSRPILAA